MKNVKRRLAAVLTTLLLFTLIPAGFAAPATAKITAAIISELTQTNAVLTSSVTWSGEKPTQVGFFLGKSISTLKRIGYDTVLPNSIYIQFCFNLNTECNMTLTPNTTYYCRPYAVAGGKCVKGDMLTFQTPAISASFSSIQATSITNTAAQISCYLTYQSSIKPSKVGMVLEYGSTCTMVDSDTAVPTSTTFQIRCALTGLTAVTKYTLQPFAVINGIVYRGAKNVSFQTLATAKLPTVSKTLAEALRWTRAQVGKKLGSGQCVALITAYYAYLGVKRPAGNAADYATNSYLPGLTPLKGAQPQAGDILVYTGGPNNWGHVAIYESENQTYHQNFNYHQYVEKLGNYFSSFSTPYWGVVRPRFK